MSEVQLKNTCDWLLGEGILSSLTTNFDVPWKEEITDGQDLDDDYYGNRSGDKVVSHLTEKLLDENNKLSSEDTERIAGVIYRKYKENWDRAWLALKKEYNPINNYDMTETETPAETTTTMTPAETTTTTKVPESTTTITPAETKTETKVPETTKTITPAETKVETKVAEVNREIKTPETNTTTKVPETTTSIKTPETTTSIKTPETTTKITPSLVKNTTENFINGFNSDNASPSNKTISTPQLISGGVGEEKVTQGTNAGEQKVTQGTKAGEEKVTQGTNAGEQNITQGQKAGADNIKQGVNPGEESLTVLEAGEEKVEQGTKAGEESITVLEAGEEKVEQGTHAGEEKITVNKAGSHVYTTQKDRELTRNGNIGVTTTQKLLTDELELRMKYNFFDSIVYPHIDKVMCMSYYKDTNRCLF